jgi:hypothetical protein
MMIEWPGRCSRCQGQIDAWTDAGFFGGKWIHKACYVEVRAEAERGGRKIDELREPTDRRHQLEWPMLGFLLMFHFGLGAAAIGWIIIDQGGSVLWGSVLIAIGLVVPLIGIAGAAVNVVSRRRVELVRQELETAGGWKPQRDAGPRLRGTYSD